MEISDLDSRKQELSIAPSSNHSKIAIESNKKNRVSKIPTFPLLILSQYFSKSISSQLVIESSKSPCSDDDKNNPGKIAMRNRGDVLRYTNFCLNHEYMSLAKNYRGHKTLEFCNLNFSSTSYLGENFDISMISPS